MVYLISVTMFVITGVLFYYKLDIMISRWVLADRGAILTLADRGAILTLVVEATSGCSHM